MLLTVFALIGRSILLLNFKLFLPRPLSATTLKDSDTSEFSLFPVNFVKVELAENIEN